ncbi:hypothetical protein A2Z33_01760 [Candidatus Gottesmanbacteria bacterium RBG_16_52_11]|uniref:ComEC/Rec2-related protein domain-containing protein n=1 Tax=Candidatus Gottesmanbacteria bacterium RBG_16_52_11 TaxID=1798374 RepID=A0A1F5YR00_9BACT|nr:MAG: hypothetical protein A2Z33_01760 [Candidatus Gottesmanbacteria bacterium RBG_16_52_11]
MLTVTDVSRNLGMYLHEPYAGLLSGILFGTKQTISGKLYENLITSGTLHIIALSGTNITILTNLVAKALKPFLSRRVTGLLTILIIMGFVWFVGASPTIVRAALMGSITLMSVIFGRPAWALWTWIITVITMTASGLASVKDLSFQLSAGASLGLILFSRNDRSPIAGQAIYGKHNSGLMFLRHITGNIVRVVDADIQATLAAQLFTVPIIMFTFRRISLVAPLSNLLIGWILPPMTAVGLVTALAAYVFPPLAAILSYVVWLPLRYIVMVVDVTSRIPGAAIVW